jgi:hypothetical protein
MANGEERERHACHCAFALAPGSQPRRLNTAALVQRDVISLFVLDFILRLVGCRMVDVAFVIDVPSMDFDDFSAHRSTAFLCSRGSCSGPTRSP